MLLYYAVRAGEARHPGHPHARRREGEGEGGHAWGRRCLRLMCYVSLFCLLLSSFSLSLSLYIHMYIYIYIHIYIYIYILSSSWKRSGGFCYGFHRRDSRGPVAAGNHLFKKKTTETINKSFLATTETIKNQRRKPYKKKKTFPATTETIKKRSLATTETIKKHYLPL